MTPNHDLTNNPSKKDALTVGGQALDLSHQQGGRDEVVIEALNPDFDRPAGLSPEGERAYAVLREWVKTKGDDYSGGCKAFYSPREWADRGEEYGLGSELIVVHDGGCLSTADDDYGRWVGDTMTDLDALGLYVEHCTCWYSALYPSAPMPSVGRPTPGNWSANINPPPGAPAIRGTGPGPGLPVVFNVEGSTSAERVANTHLLASAKDLYAALKHYLQSGDITPADHLNPRHDSDYMFALNAIAKAEGRKHNGGLDEPPA